MKRLVLLLFIISNVYGICVQAERSVYLPAIDPTGGGQLIRIDVSVAPGSGKVLVSLPPYVGLLTQQSVITAADVAFPLANVSRNDCDVTIGVDQNETSTVDGPSGGTALTLAIFSALEGKAIRNDTAITGTIDESGAVGQVGGVPEKVEAAGLDGKRVFILPTQDMDTILTLYIIKNKYNMSLVEVGDIRQATDVAFSNNKTIDGNLILEKNQLPAGLKSVVSNGSDSEVLKNVASAFIDRGNADTDSLQVSSDQDREIVDFFRNELNISQNLLDKGYVYSSANTAFLAEIDLEFLKADNIDSEGIVSILQDSSACAGALGKKSWNEGNLELQIGSEVRKNWALKKIGEINSTGNNEAGVLALYHEALYAKAWCEVSAQLAQVSGEGKALDESKLKDMASREIAIADNGLQNKSFAGIDDALWHLDTAKQAYGNNDYGAAIFDSVYAIAMTNATENAQKLDMVTLKEQTASMINTKTMNFWASAYRTHASYYYAMANQKNDMAGMFIAYRLATYALLLDKTTDEIKAALSSESSGTNSNIAPIAGQNTVVQYASNQYVLPLIFAMLLVILLLQVYMMKKLKL